MPSSKTPKRLALANDAVWESKMLITAVEMVVQGVKVRAQGSWLCRDHTGIIEVMREL